MTRPDGQRLAVTYGHWLLAPGSTHPNHPEGRGLPPFILQARLDPKQLDTWSKEPAHLTKPAEPAKAKK